MKFSTILIRARAYNPVVLSAGLTLVFGGLFAVLIMDNTTWWNITLVSLGAAVLGLFLAANLAEVKETGKKRSTVARANLTLVAVAMLGIVCGLNYVVSRHPVRFDLTSSKVFTLSSQTQELLKKLTQEVNVTFLTSSKRSSAEIQRAQQLLEEYSKISTKFKLKVVDVDKNPSEAKRLNIHEYNTVVFESGPNRKDVLQRDYVTYAMGQGRQPTPKFQGEGAFTSALVKMGDTTRLTFYLTEGHGEKDFNNPQQDGMNNFKDMLEKENYTINPLNLPKTGKIPDDAAVVAVIGPTKSFQASEVALLQTYLKKGGKMILCVDPLANAGLDALLRDYGVKLDNDIVVDPVSHNFMDAREVIPQYSYHAIVEKLTEGKIASIIPFARSLQKVDPVLKGVTQTPFLQTTDKGWGVTNFKQKRLEFHPGVDLKGPVILAMACEWAAPETPDKKTRLVVIGSSSFLSNQYLPAVGNLDVGLNSFSWAAVEENKISIHPKEDENRVVNLSNVTANLVFYLTVVIIPGGVLIAGVVVWYRRKSL